jgi:hypothetical protein
LVLSAVAFAGNNPIAKVAIHVRAHNAKLACTLSPAIVGCADVVTSEPGFSVDAFPVFYDLVEYKAVDYGICWPAWTYSAAFTNCADLVIGAIVFPGDGASGAWFACETGVCVPGFVWLYADGPGLICPCPYPPTGMITLVDCNQGTDAPCGIFCAGVYGEVGEDPCDAGASATEQSTWGEIKAIFE